MKRIIVITAIFIFGILGARIAGADIADLQTKIGERNAQIAALEKEIAAYQGELDKLGGEASTLKNAIAELDLTRRKLLTEIKATESKISAATLSIDSLTENILVQENRIGRGNAGLEKALRLLAEVHRENPVEIFLNENGFSGAWREADALRAVEARLTERIRSVKELKAGLEQDRTALDAKRRELTGLKNERADRKRIADGERATQQAFLTSTKNKETNYKKLLQDRLALREAFENELLEYESQLKFELDPSRLPQTGSGVLRWPLDTIKITQYFGATAFAKSGAYNGQGHNGVDFRAGIGTPVKTALSGIVKGVGDTDRTCSGASYGKWVLVEHGNGLTTLYAHLSLIRVAEGQGVSTGEVIAYSGATGYATGPHLHFTVFATQGVEVATRPSRVCVKNYILPVANPGAYLNPLSYL
ncbi:MAG: peptidoglycan DD-metalloendopeptidase family protein [bacterium]|nr:peptidoglycan DD-metalloendopeptidase family protein [bacterium]